MLVIEDSDFDAAVESLRRAGFRDAPWSYGSMSDPQFFKEKFMQDLHRRVAREHQSLDQNSTRFLFPVESNVKERVALLRCSYAHLSLSSIPESRFTREGNIYYPDKELLVESFVKTLVKVPKPDSWTAKLNFWTISYVYGQLMVSDDVLDSCSDDKAKAWFNEHIRRYSGGIDRVTVTKWVGKKGYNGPGSSGYVPPEERTNGVQQSAGQLEAVSSG